MILVPKLSHVKSLDRRSLQLGTFYHVLYTIRFTKIANIMFGLGRSNVLGPCTVTSKLGFKCLKH